MAVEKQTQSKKVTKNAHQDPPNHPWIMVPPDVYSTICHAPPTKPLFTKF
jgi:hypothetical protein